MAFEALKIRTSYCFCYFFIVHKLGCICKLQEQGEQNVEGIREEVSALKGKSEGQVA
jgi:hypothetical protein